METHEISEQNLNFSKAFRHQYSWFISFMYIGQRPCKEAAFSFVNAHILNINEVHKGICS